MESLVAREMEERVRLQNTLQPILGMTFSLPGFWVKDLKGIEETARQIRREWNLEPERAAFYFGISIGALLYRLLDLNIINKLYFNSWSREINRRGWKTQEPNENPPEEPTWLRRNLLRAYSEGLLARPMQAEEQKMAA